MRTGAGLLLIGVGAILAFAVTTNTSVFNLHTAGVRDHADRHTRHRPSRPGGQLGGPATARRRYVTRGKNVYPAYVTRDPTSPEVQAGLPAVRESQAKTEVVEDVYED